jgi:hypothetical protein
MKCLIEHCDNEGGKITGRCKNCNASLCRWDKRKPVEVLARRNKLHLYDNRMEAVQDRIASRRRT